MLAGLAATLVTAPAAATPGTPGTPQANAVIFSEDFENGVATTPVGLADYVGADGQKYTADASWLTDCNGQIRSMSTPYTTLGNCSSDGFTSQLGQLAYALGAHDGDATPADNHVVAAYTQNNPGNLATEFTTISNIPLATSSGRYLTFSVDAAALNCSVSGPQYQFAFINEAGVATDVGGLVNACSSATTVTAPAYGTLGQQAVRVGTYTSNGSLLFNGSSLGIRMQNANGSGVGNDAAFDNIRILDVTPQLDKSFSPAVAATGGTSTLTFTITNTAELAAKNGWSFRDTLPTGLTVAAIPNLATTCPAGAVTAPAGSTGISATGNLSAGMASCVVSVNVTSPTTGAFSNGPGNVTETGLNPPGTSTVHFESPALTLVKHAGTPTDVNGDGITDAGDTIAYSFTVTNTGDVPLTSVGVTDPKAGSVTCPTPALAPTEAETCTADALYTVTPADVTVGAVDNSATAHGTPPSGVPIGSAQSTTITPAADPAPALSVVKSATPSGSTTFTPGQVITYDFVVTNTGNVTMSNIAIDDSAFTGTGTPPAPSCAQTTLAPQAQTLCTAQYTLTPADVNAGHVTNTASATGTPPGSTTQIPPSPPSTVVIPTPEAPGITLTKTAAPTTADAAGQTITFSYLVTNTGNVSLSGIGVDEIGFTGSGSLGTLDCPLATLLAGQFETCTADYTVTQTDVDGGAPILNAASATGTTPSGTPVASGSSTAIVNVTRAPALTLAKTADVTSAAVGQKVTYSFRVTNTGNVTITDPTIDETAFSGSGSLSAIDCPAGPISIAPGDHVTCTASYVATQDDVDSGALTNTAMATGTPPAGLPAPFSPPSTAVVTTSPAPAMTVVKTADVTKITHVGQVVTYSFEIANTGNVTITSPTVHEGAFTGHGSLSTVTCPASASSLSPAETATCTATYTVVAADLTRGGRLSNTATVSGTLRGGGSITSDPSTAVVTSDPPGGLALTGSDILPPAAAIALPLLLLGGIAIVVRRRHRDDGSAAD